MGRVGTAAALERADQHFPASPYQPPELCEDAHRCQIAAKELPPRQLRAESFNRLQQPDRA